MQVVFSAHLADVDDKDHNWPACASLFCTPLCIALLPDDALVRTPEGNMCKHVIPHGESLE